MLRRRNLLAAADGNVSVRLSDGTILITPSGLNKAFLGPGQLAQVTLDNQVLRGWGALGRVWSQPYWPSDGVDALGLYRPLHIALLATVWNATGGSALWFHLYALSLAALSSLLRPRL